MQSTIDRQPAGTGQKIISSLGLSAWAVGALLVAGVAVAAGGKLSEAEARYQQDRAACNSGQSYQDRATCLREAGAARQEAKRGHLGDGQSSYEQNRTIRCERLTAGDREDCLRRMRGEGTVSGSVEGGGVYRELRTTVPAKQGNCMHQHAGQARAAVLDALADTRVRLPWKTLRVSDRARGLNGKYTPHNGFSRYVIDNPKA